MQEIDRARVVNGVMSFETNRNKTYKSAGNKIFDIRADMHGLYFITMPQGGELPEMCYDRFTTYKDAEKVLVKYLSKNDNLTRAVYPGSPKEKRIIKAKGKQPDINE